MVGASVLGQNITGIRITRGINTGQREILKPMVINNSNVYIYENVPNQVRYVGNMHGNEPVGREMLNHFAETLLEGYGM